MMMEEMEVGPNRCTTIVYYAWKIFTCLFLHVILVAMVVSYCVMGAFMFESLEKEHEIYVRQNVTKIRRQVIENLWNLTYHSDVLRQYNWTSDAQTLVKNFEGDLVRAMRKEGWNGSDDGEERNLQWTFAGALFYSIIVITTIGVHKVLLNIELRSSVGSTYFSNLSTEFFHLHLIL
ncbi:hypothetical protein M8J75_007815 [Diaphorina citri]|nr:hypothetical protein M8J75_007815 [Diaphorina citri]